MVIPIEINRKVMTLYFMQKTKRSCNFHGNQIALTV